MTKIKQNDFVKISYKNSNLIYRVLSVREYDDPESANDVEIQVHPTILQLKETQNNRMPWQVETYSEHSLIKVEELPESYGLMWANGESVIKGDIFKLCDNSPRECIVLENCGTSIVWEYLEDWKISGGTRQFGRSEYGVRQGHLLRRSEIPYMNFSREPESLDFLKKKF